MGDVSTQKTKLGVSNNRVGVGTIDVNLSTSLVNHFTDVGDSFFVNTVSRRIGDH